MKLVKYWQVLEVSHAYEREVNENWPYNLYSMVHGKSVKDVKQIVRKMSRKCRISDYCILFTEKEFKKTPPTYINCIAKTDRRDGLNMVASETRR